MGFTFNNISTKITSPPGGGGFKFNRRRVNQQSQVWRLWVEETTSFPTRSISYVNPSGDISYVEIYPSQSAYIYTQTGSFEEGYNIGYGLTTNDWILASNLFTTQSISSSTNPYTIQLFTTPGAGNWNKPTGVTEVIVECFGGGGAGAGAINIGDCGGGGAGGNYARSYFTYSSTSQSIPYIVATLVAGGTGVGSNGNDTTWDTNQVVAKGGGGGQIFNGAIGPGGTPTSIGNIGNVVFITFSGSQGEPGRGGSLIGGAGGSGAGTSGQGLELGGIPGFGGESATPNGGAGEKYGGGGGGAIKEGGANKTGGAGAQGLIRISYR